MCSCCTWPFMPTLSAAALLLRFLHAIQSEILQNYATHAKFGTTSGLMSQVRAQCHSLVSHFCRPDGYSQKGEKNMRTEQNKQVRCASKDFSATSQSGRAVSWNES